MQVWLSVVSLDVDVWLVLQNYSKIDRVLQSENQVHSRHHNLVEWDLISLVEQPR